MTDLREAASGLLEAVVAAIEAGDWKVDGACDPHVEIIRLKNILAKPEQGNSIPNYPITESNTLFVDAVNVSQERVDETAKREHEPVAKIWLWRNFVNDKPEYWAFDNPYPINLDNDDPQTIGSPCGYALLKPSRDGSRGRKKDEVLREIKGALARQQTRSQSLAQPEQESVVGTKTWVEDGKVFTQNLYASDIYKTPPKREWVGLTVDEVYEFVCTTDSYINLAKAIEAKLKEKNND